MSVPQDFSSTKTGNEFLFSLRETRVFYLNKLVCALLHRVLATCRLDLFLDCLSKSFYEN